VLLVQLLTTLFQDSYIISEIEKLAVSILSGEYVIDKVDELAVNAGSSLLKDPATIARAQQFLRDTVNDPQVQETVGYALWESLKIAITPSIFHPSSPQEFTKIPEFPQQTPIVQTHPSETLWVPEHLIPGVAEILFRDAYEKISATWGLQCTQEGLILKKRAFEEELLKQGELSKPVKRFLEKFSQKHFDDIFRQDQALIDMGGEEALIIRAKQKVDQQILVYQEYLTNMEKLKKGYIFHTFTPKQEESRRTIESTISTLEVEKENEIMLLEKELAGIMKENPVVYLKQGTLEEYLKGEGIGMRYLETGIKGNITQQLQN